MKFLVAFALSASLHASLLDWISPVSEQAQKVLEGFDDVVEKALVDYEVPGTAIGVVVDGKLVYAKGFGVRDVGQKQPVTKNTVFPVGSFTKAFTAFAIAHLVEQKKVDFDSRVIDILPDFRLYDSYATQNITIRDLLTHRSGLPRHGFVCYNASFSREEVLKKLRYLEPSCGFRERYQYNDLMYVVAGAVVERLAGKSWEEFLAEMVIAPLAMKHTSLSLCSLLKEKDFACPHILANHQLEKMEFRDMASVGPAGAMNSNVLDLAHWLQMQMENGMYCGRKMISPALLQEMHAPQVLVPGTPEIKEAMLYAYGLGWGIASYRGHYLLSHDGLSDGFTSAINLLPQEKIGVVVLSNRNFSPFARFLSLEIMDRILSLPAIDWIRVGLDLIKNGAVEQESFPHKTSAFLSRPFDEMTGFFEHPGYGILEIDHTADGKLQMIFNGITSSLQHCHYDVFSVLEEDQTTLFSRKNSRVQFFSGANGEIESVAVPFEPAVPDIIFKKRKEHSYSSSYLHRFVGTYKIYGYTVDITLKNHALYVMIPGQPTYELVPGIENEFSVKSVNGFHVRFSLDGQGRVKEAFLIQPYGTFTAVPC